MCGRYGSMCNGLKSAAHLDALETLAHDLPDTLDLVLLDGAKALYADILDRIDARLRQGSIRLS